MTCAQVCWKNIGAWASDFNHNEEIDCVFEEGTDGSGLVLQSHTDIVNNHPDIAKEWHMGGIGFRAKRHKPLQAADFFAYESYKRMIENITRKTRWRKSIESVVSDIPVYATFLNDEATDDIILNLSQLTKGG
jgi:hypothetical protein